ncbi:MAG: DUF438 domain-containing protein [Planctomycetota bacterium]|jgi:DUF438 domain-containing protein
MASTDHSSKAKNLTRLLKRLNHGEDPNLLRKEANHLVTNVGPQDIARAEQNLINDGYSTQLVQQLSATLMLMGIFEEQSANLKSQLAANHILRRIMVEHNIIRCLLADLDEIVDTIGCLDELTDVSLEFRKLSRTIEHLKATKEHIEREEDIIFPYLKKHVWMRLCQTIQGEHIYLRTEIDNLFELIVLFNNISFEEFKARLITIVQNFSVIMREHLCQEDNILYPIALGVINDAIFWEKMKAVCDEIGYCGVGL